MRVTCDGAQPLEGAPVPAGRVPSSKNRTRRHGLVRGKHLLPLPSETETPPLPCSKPATAVALLAAAAHGFMALGQQVERPDLKHRARLQAQAHLPTYPGCLWLNGMMDVN